MNTRQLFDDLHHALNALGFHIVSSQLDNSVRDASYRLHLEAISYAPGKAVTPIKPAVPKAPVCECGAAKTGGLHSSWCPLTAAAKP